jgi:hypothetical protein
LRHRKGEVKDGEADGCDDERDIQVARSSINSAQQIPEREPAAS